MSEPKYELNRQYRDKIENGGTMALGGYGAHEPDRVRITSPRDLEDVEPFVGEQWGMYEPDILQRVRDPEVTEQDVEAAAAIVEAADEGEIAEGDAEEVSAEPDDEDRDAVDELPTSDDEETISEEPDVEEAEETPLHKIEDLDDEEVPTVEEISDYTRDALKETARKLNVWTDIEGTGSNGYRQKQDITSFLEPLLEEYHAEDDEQG